MEQCRMHSQQLTHNVHDASSFDILQTPFYPNFSESLEESNVTQAPHPSPSYVQQQYAPDSGALFEHGGSPPLHYDIHEQPQQGHPRLDPSPVPQQHQPRPTVAYPPFPHAHGRPNPTPQGLSHHLSRASPHSIRIPTGPWALDIFSDNANAQSTAPQGGISSVYGPTYALRPQPLYPLPTTHRSVPIHAPPEQSQPTTSPGPSTLYEQREDKTITDRSQRLRSWGGAGSLDPATGVFSRASDNTRMRTEVACGKCRARKAKCSGERPKCERCIKLKLECKYAPKRRLRGPNRPKPSLSLPDGSPRPAVAEGQKARKRVSTMSTIPRRRLQIWSQQQKQRQSQQQQGQGKGVVVAAAASAAAASPASSASSVGSGSLGYPPLSESEASPMTPHSSLDSRHPVGVSFLASPRVLVQDFSANKRPGPLSHVSEGIRDSYGPGDNHDGSVATEGMVAGTHGQDVFPDLSLRLSFENHKAF